MTDTQATAHTEKNLQNVIAHHGAKPGQTPSQIERGQDYIDHAEKMNEAVKANGAKGLKDFWESFK